MIEKPTGSRFNRGKNRVELVPHEAIKGIAEVLTYGAEKYTTYNEDGSIKQDGANNWRNGLDWMGVLASALRHLEEFRSGNDFDEESGLLHVNHALTNLAFLSENYKIHPELDNRIKPRRMKIGFDIDEVLADWTQGWADAFGTNPRPTSWSFDYRNAKLFKGDKAKLEAIYSSLKRKIEPEDLPFEPHCYITSRSIDEQVTKDWIERNGFPSRPVYTLPFGSSKVEAAIKSGIDVFVDDNVDTFLELNAAGILTYLWDCPHNKRFDAGFKRIKSLKEIPFV